MKIIDFHLKKKNCFNFSLNLNSRLGYGLFKMLTVLADTERVSDLGTQLHIRQ